MLAVSLDGRLSPPCGGAAQLGGVGDRYVLEQALAWADAVLIGAGTLRAHRSTCLIHEPQFLLQRKQDGRPLQPTALVVSRRPDFCLNWPFFQQALERHLLTPDPDLDPGSVDGFSVIHRLEPSWESTLVELAEWGFQRLVLLGGAALCGSLLEADQVDELQLTLSPRLLGGSFTWLLQTATPLPASLTSSQAWSLADSRSLGDNELLVHYCRNRSSSF